MSLKDRIKKGRKDAGLTQADVAKSFGISPQAVSGWERGEDRPSQEKLMRLARLLGKPVAWLLEEEPDLRSEDVAAAMVAPSAKRTVPVKGYVGGADGSEAHFYAVADEDFETVEAPHGSTDQTVAVEIRGKSWGALMEGWLVFYDDIRSPITDDLIGQPCVVGLADDRILLKKIVRNRRGGFDLLSNAPHSPPIEDARIEWAAKVKDVRPR